MWAAPSLDKLEGSPTVKALSDRRLTRDGNAVSETDAAGNPILDQRDRGASREDVGFRSATASISRVSCVDLQFRFFPLTRQDLEHSLLAIAIQPGHPGVSLQVRQRKLAACLGHLHFARRCCRRVLGRLTGPLPSEARCLVEADAVEEIACHRSSGFVTSAVRPWIRRRRSRNCTNSLRASSCTGGGYQVAFEEHAHDDGHAHGAAHRDNNIACCDHPRGR
jgi:hypothetical protein